MGCRPHSAAVGHRPASGREIARCFVNPRAPGSGIACDEDAAGFDGWYSDRADALAVFEDWRRRFPYWIVALVQQNLAWFGDGDFHAARDRPLTPREALWTVASTAAVGSSHHSVTVGLLKQAHRFRIGVATCARSSFTSSELGSLRGCSRGCSAAVRTTSAVINTLGGRQVTTTSGLQRAQIKSPAEAGPSQKA